MPIDGQARDVNLVQIIVRKAEDRILKALVKSNDPVLMGYVCSLLKGADITHFMLDSNMSIMEGSVGIIPRRVMVADDQIAQARTLLHEAGLAHECAEPDD